MPVPYLGNVLNGWTTKRTATFNVQTVVDAKKTTVTTTKTLDINIQPMPPQQVDKKPEGDRDWKWFTLIIKSGPYMTKNDQVTIAGTKYRIMKAIDWSESGFQKYEAIEDYA